MRFALALVAACAMVMPSSFLQADRDDSASASALRARYAQWREVLAVNPYGRPVHIASSATGDALRGEVHAVLRQPLARVRATLREPARWCDLLILPFNVQHCRVERSAGRTRLHVRIARRFDQPAQQAFTLVFDFQPVAAAAGADDAFEVRLSADAGPVGTRDYRISVAAIALGNDGTGDRSFLRLDYRYGFGLAGRLALRAYLATAGADKVGFSLQDSAPGAPPRPVGGLRGVVERNAMRYLLAIEACLDSLDAPPAQQAERRIHAWFDAIEQYPRQLHEMDKATYVALKRGQIARMESVNP